MEALLVKHIVDRAATCFPQREIVARTADGSRFAWGNAEVFSVARSAGMRCQNQWRQATDFVSHRKTTLFRWRALRNPGWIYSALP